jgi:hypothetical protein
MRVSIILHRVPITLQLPTPTPVWLQSGCSTSACSSTLLLLLLAWCLLCCRTSSSSRSWLAGQTKVPAFDNLYVRAQTAVNNLHTQNKFKSQVEGMMHTHLRPTFVLNPVILPYVCTQQGRQIAHDTYHVPHT